MRNHAFMSTRAAAKLLHVDVRTVQRWIDAGSIPAHRTEGGHRRILREDLLHYIHSKNIPIREDNGRRETSVLVVDDDAVTRRILVAMLRAIDAELTIHEAISGFSAAAVVSVHRPRLILLDLVMPGMDGAAFCRWVAENSVSEKSAVVAVTGSTDPACIQSALDAGAAEVLVKPIRRDDLERILRRHVLEAYHAG